MKDLQKGTLKAALRRKNLDPVARRVIELRLASAHATKVDTMLAWRCSDGRIRGTLQFHGAGTGRWAARGVQVQNFTRDPGDIDAKIAAIMAGDLSHYPEPLGAIADAARGAICAGPGHRLLIGDFSGVESRVLAWVAGQADKVAQWCKFDATGDPREEPYFILGKACGMPDERARQGKFVDLAFGYMGGVAAYDATTYEGDPSTKEEREKFKRIWRERHPQTVSFWSATDRGAIKAVRTPGTVHTAKCICFECDDTFLKLTLPSGRIVRYPFPRIGNNRYDEPAVFFKDTARGQWGDCNYGNGAYGGLWTENIVQAIARDLMAEAMVRLEAAGYPVILTVHDEVICEVPDGFGSLEEFKRLFVASPDWAPGLPIAAKVREGQRFNKPAETIIAVNGNGSGKIATEITVETSDTVVVEDGEMAKITTETGYIAAVETGEMVIEAPLNAGAHVVLIDISTYIHRSFHAAQGDFATATAVSILRRLLQRLLQELRASNPPTHLAAVFDAPGPTFRHEIYSDYKAHRPPDPDDLAPQLPLLHEVIRECGIPRVERAGFEADDVIASYTRLAIERGAAVTIVASDKDLMQLVDAKVTMFDPTKGRRIGAAEVLEKFGVAPEQVADVLALAGDASDNVPGVPSIGIKTAARLIAEYGDLETLLARAGEIGRPKVRQALLENVEVARLSRRLVQLDDAIALDVPLDALAVVLSPPEPIPAEPPPSEPIAAEPPAGFTIKPTAAPTIEQIRAILDAPVTPRQGNGRYTDNDAAGAYTGSSDGPTGNGHGERDTGHQVAFYTYHHADGAPYLGVKKTSTKQFPQFHWTGSAWAKGAPAGPKIPYRLPELIKAPLDAWILICAGEKDADSAAALGFVATTNPEGERKNAWVPELNAWFAGRQRVAIMEDNDKTGQAHVLEVANALRGVVPEIRIVTFRELPEHGDLTDWLKQGHGKAELLARVTAAKPHYSKPRMAPIHEWAGQPVPRPEYTVPDRIPAKQVFLFSGEGGEGKSIMLQQLCAAHAIGGAWLGCPVRQGPAIWIECEDAEDALHWRLAAIAAHYDVSFTDLANAGLQMVSMIEHDSILAATSRNGIVESTAAYDWLYELAGDTKPVLIGIASTSNIFAGNENSRSEVQQFAKMLTRIALVTGGSIALVTHPSLSGVMSSAASHEGLSGSTQWHNAVRGRAVMKKVKDGEDDSAAPENKVREIKFHKNQYGPPVASSFVRWQNGLFLPIEGVHTLDAAERADKADAVFIELLRRWTEQKRQVSVNRSSTYAPTTFAAQPEAAGLTAKDLAAAMERLLRDGLIENRTVTKGKETRSHLAIVGADGGHT